MNHGAIKCPYLLLVEGWHQICCVQVPHVHSVPWIITASTTPPQRGPIGDAVGGAAGAATAATGAAGATAAGAGAAPKTPEGDDP